MMHSRDRMYFLRKPDIADPRVVDIASLRTRIPDIACSLSLKYHYTSGDHVDALQSTKYSL